MHDTPIGLVHAGDPYELPVDNVLALFGGQHNRFPRVATS
jgi:hypothetical protein